MAVMLIQRDKFCTSANYLKSKTNVYFHRRVSGIVFESHTILNTIEVFFSTQSNSYMTWKSCNKFYTATLS